MCFSIILYNNRTCALKYLTSNYYHTHLAISDPYDNPTQPGTSRDLRLITGYLSDLGSINPSHADNTRRWTSDI